MTVDELNVLVFARGDGQAIDLDLLQKRADKITLDPSLGVALAAEIEAIQSLLAAALRDS